MLQRLCDERYLVREDGPRGRYQLTMHLPALGAQAAAHARLPRLAGPVLVRLNARTGLTAHLFVPCYDAVLCVAHRAGDTSVESRAGELLPCHCTAAGKVLLAERTAWAASNLARILPRFTEWTVTDACALREQLAAIRDAGFAVEDREHRPSSRAVAAPVHALHERAVAAVAVDTQEPVDVVLASEDVIAAARDIGAALGVSARTTSTLTPACELIRERSSHAWSVALQFGSAPACGLRPCRRAGLAQSRAPDSPNETRLPPPVATRPERSRWPIETPARRLVATKPSCIGRSTSS